MMNTKVKKTKEIAQVFKIDIKIHEAMLTHEPDSIKDKRFFIQVKSDLDKFCTGLKKGANPKWNFAQSLFSHNGIVEFKVLEKSGLIRTNDIEIGKVFVSIDNVKKLKFRKNYDVKHKQQSVGTLDITMIIKICNGFKKESKGEQGSKIEFQSIDSRSISLENEEEEYEEEEEDEVEDNIEIYDEEHPLQHHMKQMIEHDQVLIKLENDKGQPIISQNINDDHDMAEYPDYDDEDDGSDEDPIPDDEDKDCNMKPLEMIPSKNMRTKDESKLKVDKFLKQRKKIRSTSHNKHLKKRANNPNQVFKYRKTSNKPILKEQLAAHQPQEIHTYSRNHPQNISHAQTHYSPASLKKSGILDAIRNNQKISQDKQSSKMRTSHYGQEFKTHSNIGNRLMSNVRSGYGAYTPQVNHLPIDQTYNYDNQEYEDSDAVEVETDDLFQDEIESSYYDNIKVRKAIYYIRKNREEMRNERRDIDIRFKNLLNEWDKYTGVQKKWHLCKKNDTRCKKNDTCCKKNVTRCKKNVTPSKKVTHII